MPRKTPEYLILPETMQAEGLQKPIEIETHGHQYILRHLSYNSKGDLQKKIDKHVLNMVTYTALGYNKLLAFVDKLSNQSIKLFSRPDTNTNPSMILYEKGRDLEGYNTVTAIGCVIAEETDKSIVAHFVGTDREPKVGNRALYILSTGMLEYAQQVQKPVTFSMVVNPKISHVVMSERGKSLTGRFGFQAHVTKSLIGQDIHLIPRHTTTRR